MEQFYFKVLKNPIDKRTKKYTYLSARAESVERAKQRLAIALFKDFIIRISEEEYLYKKQ